MLFWFFAAFTFSNVSTVVLLNRTVLTISGKPAALGLVFSAFGAGSLVGGVG